VDNVWEQEKPEARKMLENAAESPASSARFVRQPACLSKRWLKKDTTANTTKFYTNDSQKMKNFISSCPQ
jgi:hypothetical protein